MLFTTVHYPQLQCKHVKSLVKQKPSESEIFLVNSPQQYLKGKGVEFAL